MAEYFLARYQTDNEPLHVLSEDAQCKLESYAWPGNVRELDNVVQRALILASSTQIGAADILFEEEGEVPPSEPLADESALTSNLRSREQEMIIDAVKLTGGSRKSAAAALGISARTLRYKLSRMRKEGIDVPGHSNAVA